MTHHWDDFSKSLAEGSSTRRESLRLLGAALAGAVLGPLGLGTAHAAPKPRKGQDPCKSICRCPNKKQQDACLAACRSCTGATSRLCGSCGTGITCDDLANDVRNCGACGNTCQPGRYEVAACVSGACVYSCVEGAVRCNGACTYLASDPNNCGACGNVCPDWAQRCTEGVCDPCTFPYILCGDVCVDPTSDRDHCGGCGVHCGDTEACIGGFCESGG